MNCWTTLLICIIQGHLNRDLKSSKSALSHVGFLPPYSSILEHPQIIKYFQGVYNLRPPTQKIIFVWDVKILFDYFIYKGKND